MVDALVSGASVERRVGSTPILGTTLRSGIAAITKIRVKQTDGAFRVPFFCGAILAISH